MLVHTVWSALLPLWDEERPHLGKHVTAVRGCAAADVARTQERGRRTSAGQESNRANRRPRTSKLTMDRQRGPLRSSAVAQQAVRTWSIWSRSCSSCVRAAKRRPGSALPRQRVVASNRQVLSDDEVVQEQCH